MTKFFLKISEFREATSSDVRTALVKVFSEQEEDLGDSRVSVQRHIATGVLYVPPEADDDHCTVAIKECVENFKKELCLEIMAAPLRMEKQAYTRATRITQSPLSDRP